MTTFVYLGPSLPRAEAAARLDAVFLDPVAMGDIHALVIERAQPGDRIAIIDGLFEQVPAVWHKEILFALEQGIAVYGASSMGALRAAELHRFGMLGEGRIFAAYRDGIIDDDDEVVVAHATAEFGYRVLSDAMVSLRFGLATLRDEGVIEVADCARLTAMSKARHYTSRSWPAVVADARQLGLDPAAVDQLKDAPRRFDAKADDARALLDRLAAEQATGAARVTVDFVLEQTSFWVGLSGSHAEATGSIGREDSAIVAQCRAAHPDRASILESATLAQLARRHTADWTPSRADLTAAAFELIRRNNIGGAAALRDWRHDQALDSEEAWLALLDLQARIALLIANQLPETEAFVPAAMKARGAYRDARRESQAIEARFGRDRVKQSSLADAGVEPAALQAWYERRCGKMYPDPEAHAAALQFATLRDFVGELLPVFLADQALAGRHTTGAAVAG